MAGFTVDLMNALFAAPISAEHMWRKVSSRTHGSVLRASWIAWNDQAGLSVPLQADPQDHDFTSAVNVRKSRNAVSATLEAQNNMRTHSPAKSL